MAKKRRKASSGTGDGRVWVSMGLKPSASFNSIELNVGLETTIEEGETHDDALDRVYETVGGFLEGKTRIQLRRLEKLINQARG